MSQSPEQEPRRRVRPSRPLPPPPPPSGDDAGATVALENAFEYDQQYMSPPSPPQAAAAASLPDVETLTIHSEATGVDEEGTAVDTMSTDKQASEPATAVPPKRVRPPVPKTSAAHINPYHSTLPSTEMTPPTILTPIRAHYLKKALVAQQIAYELNLITDPVLGANALGLLGPPFVLPDSIKKDVISRLGPDAFMDRGGATDLPFIRYMFHQFLLPFPFLAAAPPTFWGAKVQPFLSSFLAMTGVSNHSTMTDEERQIAESLMTKEEKKETEERKRLWTKVEKHLGLMIGVGIKLVGGEEVVRVGQAELRRIEAAHEAKRQRALQRQAAGMDNGPLVVSFDVNVVGVRLVKEKGRVRKHSHEEFIIRTQRTGVHDVFVSRRYGDFRRLAEELRIHFPDFQLPNPPPKDKSVAAAPPPPSNAGGYSYYNPLRVIYGTSTPTDTASPRPGSATNSPRPSMDNAEPGSPASPDPLANPYPSNAPLSREKNRLTLRAYLLTVLAVPEIANSPVMRSFLLSNPTTLTPPEAADIQRRLDADAVREEGRRRFREEAERRVESLRGGLAQFKGDILQRRGGLKGVFEVVRRVEKVEDLPPAEHAVMEWGRISLAATIFQIYVASDTASESLASIKRLHGIMPYFMLKGILKISNPVAMIRGVLDLFLARPFGGQSLLQKMFSTSLTEELRYIADDIQAVADKVEDPVLCEKLEQYVEAPFEIQEIYRKDAIAEGCDLLVVILRSPDMPTLSRPQLQRVARASRAYKQYKLWQADLSDSDDDEGPDNDDAWLFEDLNILLKLMMRKKEKEALLALIFEGVTAELLKDIITIFYSPLAQVYKAASIADSLGDLQAFITDMIKTAEQVEELSQEDPGRTVQTFIDLVQRHEQSFYTFVHNVQTKGQSLFDSLMSWIELFLNYARDGLPEKLDLEVLLPHAGAERVAIMKEVDDLAQYHYKLKLSHEEKIRRRFVAANTEGMDQQSAEETALVHSVLQSLNVSETAMGSAGEIAVEESEEESDDDQYYESLSDTASIQSNRTGASQQQHLDVPDKSVRKQRSHQSLRGKSSHQSLKQGPNSRKNDQPRRDSLRNSLDARRGRTTSGGTEDDVPPPVPPKDTPSGRPAPDAPHHAQQHGSHGVNHPHHPEASQRRRRRKHDVIAPPQLNRIADLRPLFVEVVKPMLVVKPMQP